MTDSDQPETHPAIGWRRLESDRVECLLCPHACRLSPGQTAPCRVRHNAGGRLVSSSYGRPVLLAVEAIEKKSLFHVWPGTKTLSLGTAGCNLHCGYCLNARASQSKSDASARFVAPEAVVASAAAAQARCIAFTYTEPAVYAEYLVDIARAARAEGFGLVAKSNGFWSKTTLELLSPWLDAANIDIKSWSSPGHRRMTGGALEPVLDTVRGLRERGVWIEVSTVLTPGLCDDRASLAGIAGFVASELGATTPWHVQRFFPFGAMGSAAPTSISELTEAVMIGRQHGLKHVYCSGLGPIGGMNTLCPECGTVVLDRSVAGALGNGLIEGGCSVCGYLVDGIGLGGGSDAYQ